MEGKNRRNVLQDTGFFISYALFNWENGDTDYDGGMKKEKVTNTFERESLTVMWEPKMNLANVPKKIARFEKCPLK